MWGWWVWVVRAVSAVVKRSASSLTSAAVSTPAAYVHVDFNSCTRGPYRGGVDAQHRRCGHLSVLTSPEVGILDRRPGRGPSLDICGGGEPSEVVEGDLGVGVGAEFFGGVGVEVAQLSVSGAVVGDGA